MPRNQEESFRIKTPLTSLMRLFSESEEKGPRLMMIQKLLVLRPRNKSWISLKQPTMTACLLLLPREREVKENLLSPKKQPNKHLKKWKQKNQGLRKFNLLVMRLSLQCSSWLTYNHLTPSITHKWFWPWWHASWSEDKLVAKTHSKTQAIWAKVPNYTSKHWGNVSDENQCLQQTPNWPPFPTPSHYTSQHDSSKQPQTITNYSTNTLQESQSSAAAEGSEDPEEPNTTDVPHCDSPSNLFSLERHLGGELMETPQKATKSVPTKIDVVNQQPPKPSHQTNPEPSSTQTHTPTQQMTIPEPVIETVVRESVLVTESEPSVSIPVSEPTQNLPLTTND